MRSKHLGAAQQQIGVGPGSSSRGQVQAKRQMQNLLLGAGKNNRNSEPMSETRAKEESWKVMEVR